MYETTKYNLAGSTSPPLSIDDLIALSSEPEQTRKALNFNSLKLTYGMHRGNEELRKNIAGLYETDVDEENVVTANGASGANQMVLQALLGAHSHVICLWPTYGQLFDVPKAVGVDVSFWKLDPDHDWRLDLGQLQELIRPSTKMIVLNNPNNPTGTDIPNDLQREIIELAKANDLIVFADEVFRPLFHDGSTPKSILEWDYTKTIVTGSASKAYGFPGARTGWVISKDKALLRKCETMRAYAIGHTTPFAEAIVAEALSDRCRPRILANNLKLAKTNRSQLETFIKKHNDVLSWVRPTSSSTTLLKFSTRNGTPVDDVQFCSQLEKEADVLFAPASLCFGREKEFQGWVRCHILVNTELLNEALAQIEAFITSDLYDEVK